MTVSLNKKEDIESLLEEVEELEDSLLYSYLCKTKPNGKRILTEEEKREFEEWLGIV